MHVSLPRFAPSRHTSTSSRIPSAGGTQPLHITYTPHRTQVSVREQNRIASLQLNTLQTRFSHANNEKEAVKNSFRMMQIAIIRSHPLRAPISRACLEPAEQRWPAEGEEAFASSRPLFVVFQAGEVCATVARSKAGIRVFVLPRPSRGPDWRARARRQPLR